MKKTAIIFLFVMLLSSGAYPYGGKEPEIQILEESLISKGVYMVEEGDSLWDICDQLFDNPWYWTTLWSFNPQITNPHWIFPGDTIYLRPKWVGKVKSVIVWSKSRYSEKPKDIMIWSRFKGFLPEEMYKSSGEIKYSREDKKFLGQYDEVYVDFSIPKKIHKGDRFLVYRTLGELKHPVTKKHMGYKIEFIGVIKILDREQKFKKAVILKSFKEIERGDKITTFVNYSSLQKPIKNKSGVSAVVIDIFNPMDMAGEYQYVFLDKGKENGVKNGNRFIIQWKGDGLLAVKGDDLKSLPMENFGEIMVVKTFDNVSLGIITRSIKEIMVGQHVKMLKGY